MEVGCCVLHHGSAREEAEEPRLLRNRGPSVSHLLRK